MPSLIPSTRPPKTALDPTLPLWAQAISTDEYDYRRAQQTLGTVYRMRNEHGFDRIVYTSFRRHYLKAASDALNRWRESV